MRRLACLLLCLLPTAAAADAAAFARSNLIFAFHHEAGHALIDILALPVPGGEEDAADALAVLLIDRLHGEAGAAALVRDAALAFALFAQREAPDTLLGRHALDLDRRAALVCLYYGAAPDRRRGLAAALGLTAAELAPCPARHAATVADWDALLALPPQDHRPAFRLVSRGDDPLTRAIAAEVEALNGEIGLPAPVDVTLEPCGEANALYDPRARRIVLCTEYAEDLARLWARAGGR